MDLVQTRAVLSQARRPRREQVNDAELGDAVSRAQDGDETAFATAYRIVQPGLLGYLRGLLGDEAEDVASDAWLEIARNLGRFKGDGAGFRGWTALVARHRALDHLRCRRVRPRSGRIEDDVLELPGARTTDERALETLSTEQALELVLGLPRDPAEAVLPRVVVGKRPGAVRTAAHRGVKRLGQQLGVGRPQERV